MWNTSFIKVGILRTFEEIKLQIILFISNFLPDLTIFSILRAQLIKFIARVGPETRIKKNIYINSLYKVSIGRNYFINRNVQFDCSGSIFVGNNCSIGFNSLITTSTHIEKSIDHNSDITVLGEDVYIGNGVWIGANVTILPAADIEDNCIIGAGSLVKGKLEKNGVYVGVPAKRIRDTLGIKEKKY